MILRPPRSTRTDTLFPYTTLFRSYFEKIRALKAGVWPCRLQHGIIEYDFGLILLVSLAEVMIKRSDWGRSDSTARGENLGFVDDDLQRKHSARTLSLIMNESWGIEGRSEEPSVGKTCVRTCRSRGAALH